MAEALGAYAEHITDPAEVGPVIEMAKEISATGQPCVLEVIAQEEAVFSSIMGRRIALTGTQTDRQPTRDML